MEFIDTMTLAEARDALRKLVNDGHRCPCCTQFAKVYKRKIHSSMAKGLIFVWRKCAHEWFDMMQVFNRKHPHDMAKLRYWGLLEEKEGSWRVTGLGACFVCGDMSVKKYARIYNGKCLSLTGEDTSIKECLGDKFDYNELMRA